MWVLIMYMFIGENNGMLKVAACSITKVEGFKSYDACYKAALNVENKERPSYIGFRTVCVEQ